MPIKNYTTSIAPSTTAGEISTMVARRGARRIQTTYDSEGQPVGLAFMLDLEDRGEWAFELPVRVQGVQLALINDGVAPRYQTDDHAARVAWRIARDWMAAQLALVDAGAAKLDEVMLPYLMMPGGETAYRWINRHQRQISSGERSAAGELPEEAGGPFHDGGSDGD